MTHRLRRRVLGLVETWQFWAILFALAMAYVILALHAKDSREAHTEARVAQEQAIRIAERRSAADAAVQRCLGAIPYVNHINAVLEEFRQTLVLNGEEIHASTPRGTPVYQSQADNLARLRKLDPHIAAPTRAACAALAAPAAMHG